VRRRRSGSGDRQPTAKRYCDDRPMNLGRLRDKGRLALAIRRLQKQETVAIRWYRFCAGRHEEGRDAQPQRANEQLADELSSFDPFEPLGWSHESIERVTSKMVSAGAPNLATRCLPSNPSLSAPVFLTASTLHPWSLCWAYSA
jgi:hypothetical protein